MLNKPAGFAFSLLNTSNSRVFKDWLKLLHLEGEGNVISIRDC